MDTVFCRSAGGGLDETFIVLSIRRRVWGRGVIELGYTHVR